MTPDGATWHGMLALMRGDFARTVQECIPNLPVRGLRRWGHLIVPSAYLAINFRLAHLLHAKGWWRLAAMITLFNQRLCGVLLHPASRIGPGLFVPHPTGVTFCGRAGVNLTLYPMAYVTPTRLPRWRATPQPDWPRLGNDVRVGTYAAVIGNVAVGSDTVIGIQVVLQTDLEAGQFAAVRPNWRVVRNSTTVEPEPLESAEAEP